SSACAAIGGCLIPRGNPYLKGPVAAVTTTGHPHLGKTRNQVRPEPAPPFIFRKNSAQEQIRYSPPGGKSCSITGVGRSGIKNRRARFPLWSSRTSSI